MIGKADIEESKSNVAINVWLPQDSYPYGNLSGTSRLTFYDVLFPLSHRHMKLVVPCERERRNHSPYRHPSYRFSSKQE
ncbi:hypothetical protein BDA99DRAFT_500815 [Phascolomyces articulosus]|uniref:Uncharacterized protein n=1 Tax=Phascolomyces articulosus TaxID=60185 RepID=A0AAD5KI58_9FUNG|nr:hypothetical protein BDA99DRAFT_500815 [Phascolomyces articulosus]